MIRFDCMKWSFEMTVYWNVEMIICWGDEMIICWNVKDVLWYWLIVSIFEIFRWDCICCVRYEDDFDWNVNDWCIFFKKIWSNECVWRPINGSRWRKKMIKWMWCCYQIMSRQTVDLMSEMLHLMLLSSNALTIECDVRHAALNFIAIRWKTVDVRIAAFDRDRIKCTLTIVWENCQNCI